MWWLLKVSGFWQELKSKEKEAIIWQEAAERYAKEARQLREELKQVKVDLELSKHTIKAMRAASDAINRSFKDEINTLRAAAFEALRGTRPVGYDPDLAKRFKRTHIFIPTRLKMVVDNQQGEADKHSE